MCMWKYLLLLSGAYCLEAVRPSCNLHCGQIRKKDPESKPFLDLKNMSGCLFHGSRRLSSWRSHATLYSSSSAPSNLQLPITDDAILDFVFHYIRYLFLELAIVCCTILHRNKPAYPSKTNTCWILKPCPLFDQSQTSIFLDYWLLFTTKPTRKSVVWRSSVDSGTVEGLKIWSCTYQ